MLAFAGSSALAATESPVSAPGLIVEGIPFDIKIESAELESVPFSLMVSDDDEVAYTFNGIIPTTVRSVHVPSSGTYQIVVSTAGDEWESSVKSLAGWVTLVPPLAAILLALIFRQVYMALLAGVWIGATIMKGNNPLTGFLYVIDHYIVDTLAGSSGWDHYSIVIFTMLLGGIVGVITANGGANGVVKKVSRLATTASRGQLATWLMGIIIFFDDYTNTLVVGNTMRPVTDRLRISREKLSYIVDSTAAPVACIAVITSWIGFEISLLKDAFAAVGLVDHNPFSTFVASVPYSFYPVLTLVFVFFVALLSRDFGPMLKAERRARSTGEVLAPGSSPVSNIDIDVQSDEEMPERWINAAVPVLIVIFGTVVGLITTGRASLLESGVESPSLFAALKEGNSFVALMWSSFGAAIIAVAMTVAQRLLSMNKAVSALISGMKAMTPAMIILVLAWAIGAVCTDLHTADYLVANLSGVIAPQLLPMLIFIVAGAVSFSTGTSWGTMTILTPLCIPLVVQISELNELTLAMQNTVLLSTISAILSGAVFGDHCSPISDTTIMSSMASTADHIDHVRTQLPYALTVAFLSIAVCYMPVALGLPVWMVLPLGGVAVFAVIRFFGRPTDVTS